MREKLIEFFESKLGLSSAQFQDTTLLYSSGLLDSLGMVEMVMFIEEESGIRFSPDDVILDNLDSIDRVLRFVASARQRE